ncbi:leucine-rich alpha-2-glycoprotein-like [Suncus etruscus]|uniref:leucine-rich alpha-2-glycoprotein-like n=1 Tax=Suncus etruscus TaxID=109475 RepID=UPI00210F3A12|nr:leucine-rich alpha-2-glycoprotein-like [Suncus etruscus]
MLCKEVERDPQHTSLVWFQRAGNTEIPMWESQRKVLEERAIGVGVLQAEEELAAYLKSEGSKKHYYHYKTTTSTTHHNKTVSCVRSSSAPVLYLARSLFPLLLIVAFSAHPNTACIVLHLKNGTSVGCFPPEQVPRTLPENTIHVVVEFFNLTKLPKEFLQSAPNLRQLHLSNNQLQNLSTNLLRPVPRLQVLDLTRNAITELTPGLFELSEALQTLVVKENRLQQLEASSLQGLCALEHLDLSGNQLSALPLGLLANLTRLRILDVSANRLEALPPDLLRGPQQLERLHLEGNRLRVLEKLVLAPQPHLRYLFLGDNQLQEVEAGAFQHLLQLDMLDLANNSLSRVPEGLLGSLGQPGRAMADGFDLSSNPWVCGPDLDHLYRWLLANEEKMFSKEETLCAEPAHLRGQKLLDLARAL